MAEEPYRRHSLAVREALDRFRKRCEASEKYDAEYIRNKTKQIVNDAAHEMIRYIKIDEFLLQIPAAGTESTEPSTKHPRRHHSKPENKPGDHGTSTRAANVDHDIDSTRLKVEDEEPKEDTTSLFIPDPDLDLRAQEMSIIQEDESLVGVETSRISTHDKNDGRDVQAVDFVPQDSALSYEAGDEKDSHRRRKRLKADAKYMDDDDVQDSDVEDLDDGDLQREAAEDLLYLLPEGDEDDVSDISGNDQSDEELGEEEILAHPELERYPEQFVNVYGKPIKVRKYFGAEWTAMIRKLEDQKAVPQPDYCATELKPWHLVGIAKLKYLTLGPFSGGILGDEQGLGKSLTTLAVLMDDIKTNPNPEGFFGFNLIVTTKTCVPQWLDEIKFHLGQEAASRSFHLNDPSMDVNELLDGRHWFAICTYQFVLSRYLAFQKYLKFYRIVLHHGLSFALNELRPTDIPDLNQRHVNSLFSPIYVSLDLPIRHLVLDEAQFVTNINSNTHLAMKSLYYNRIVLLSGTFIPNKWHDVYGLVDLLKGHPFKTRAQFMTSFAHKDQLGQYQDPSLSKRHRLIKFLQAFTVSRPETLLDLKDLDVRQRNLMLDQDKKS